MPRDLPLDKLLRSLYQIPGIHNAYISFHTENGQDIYVFCVEGKLKGRFFARQEKVTLGELLACIDVHDYCELLIAKIRHDVKEFVTNNSFEGL